MLKDRSLKWILLFSLLIAIATPLLNSFYVAPQFTGMVIATVERDASSLCAHIGREVISDEYWQDWVSKGMMPDFLVTTLTNAATDLGLIKIKFFLADGTTIYSSDISDVGKVNRHEYFHAIVAKGKTYSKLVKHQTASLEGDQYRQDVAETYVPIMREGSFSGAFELYYDVTAEVARIRKLALQVSIIPAVFAALFFLLVLRTLINLQRSIDDRYLAEQDLVEALDAAWQLTETLEEKNHELLTVNREVEAAHSSLQAAQSQMLQKEKMASIGQLAAGVAHEINNPIGFVSSNLRTLNRYLERLSEYFATEKSLLQTTSDSGLQQRLAEEASRLKLRKIRDDLPELIAESLDGAERVRSIVQNLKTFSRVDEAIYKESDLNACLESTINIVWNEIKYKATLERDYADLPMVPCYPQQLNQVFMNLLVNAAHAIEEQGVIKVRTWVDERMAKVSITDNGCGMSPDIQHRIFEPFFTTKEVGKGTGLGMSIAYEIIKKHDGEIALESSIGEGTTITISLPLNTNKLEETENDSTGNCEPQVG